MVLISDTTTSNDSISPKQSGGKSWVVWTGGSRGGVQMGHKATEVPLLLKPYVAQCKQSELNPRALLQFHSLELFTVCFSVLK